VHTSKWIEHVHAFVIQIFSSSASTNFKDRRTPFLVCIFAFLGWSANLIKADLLPPIPPGGVCTPKLLQAASYQWCIH